MSRRKISGIYKIENIINGKVYIGQTQDIYKRWHEHQRMLQNGTHYNRHLSGAYNKYGPDSFRYSILEECDIEDLHEREIYWINYYNSFNNGYNLTLGGEGILGRKLTESEMQRFYVPIVLLNTGEKFKNIKDAASKYGLNRSALSNCCSNKTRYCGLLNGKTPMVWMRTEEYEKLSRAEIDKLKSSLSSLLDRKQKPFIKKVILLNTGEIFNNPKDAAKHFNISSSAIGMCCRGKVKSAGRNVDGDRLFWMYEDDYVKLSEKDRNRLHVDIRSKTHNKQNWASVSVVLLNTGEIFNSISLAAIKYNLNISSISKCCKHEFTFSGKFKDTGEKLVWAYYDEYIRLTRDEINSLLEKSKKSPYRNHEARMKKVILLNTGEIFNSAKEAGLKYGLVPSRVTDCCKHPEVGFVGKTTTGEKLYWRYYSDYLNLSKSEIDEILSSKKQKKACKKVVLLNTMEIFSSIKEASDNYNISTPNIIRSCKKGLCAGRHPLTNEKLYWMYYDEYLNAKPNRNDSIA